MASQPVTRSAVTWSEFAKQSPGIAEAGRRLLHQFPPGAIAFLATTRADGGPRVHPVCPALHEDGLYVFVVAVSPKRLDLLRDGRFALHAFPSVADDESFYCTGRALAVTDPAARERATKSFTHHVKDETLFELRLQAALHTTWMHARTPATYPVHQHWRA